ncbi:MAG: hypothetical protein K2G22_07525, partial [Eubacterium sp.]|nr:hypothetical protein [Eubacterium sp.]
VLICVCRGIAGVYIWKYDSFFDGFLAPFLIFTVVSVLVFPIFIFREKHPKIARVWSAIVFCTAVIILLGAAILLIYAAVKAIFRF